MPLYEYQCEACGTRTEIIQRFDDPPLTVCPACGGALRKLLSAPAVHFKGSGFYITDYASKSARSAAAAGAAAESKGSAPAASASGAPAATGTSSGAAAKDAAGGSKPAAGSD